MLPYLIAGVIGYGISKLFDDNKAPKYTDGGLVAPNGKPSNLTPEQYKLVRTKAFKDWFGDWENDPENASKVVDENNEPLVVYHGSRSKFDIFDIQKSGESNTTSKVGFWFTSIKMFAENFANSIWYGKSENEVIYSVFLSVKNPKIYESEIISEKQKDKLRLKISDLQNESRSIQKKWVTGDWDYKDRMVLDASIRGSINEENFNDYLNLSNKSKDAINDGILISDINKKIKNIENKLYGLTYNDSYEKFRTDIYKVEGKSSEQANMGGLGMALSDPNGTIKKYVNSLKNKGNDGIIIKKTRFDKSNAGGLNDQYVAFESNQIKLADGTNTTFDGNNPDIRFKDGGSVSKYKDYKIEIKEDANQVVATITQNGNHIGMIYLDDFPNEPYVAYSGIDKEHSGKGLGSYVYDLLDDYSFNKTGKHITHGDINSSISAIRLWRKRLKDPNYLPDGFYNYWGDDAGEVLKELNNPDIRFDGGGYLK